MLFKEEKKVAIPTPINTTELLKDKVALITAGIGIAESFLKNGCKVITAGTNINKLKWCYEKVSAEAEKLEFIRYVDLNVLDVNTMSDKIYTVAVLFEENRIDILVN